VFDRLSIDGIKLFLSSCDQSGTTEEKEVSRVTDNRGFAQSHPEPPGGYFGMRCLVATPATTSSGGFTGG
jgi:hypothetical protein